MTNFPSDSIKHLLVNTVSPGCTAELTVIAFAFSVTLFIIFLFVPSIVVWAEAICTNIWDKKTLKKKTFWRKIKLLKTEFTLKVLRSRSTHEHNVVCKAQCACKDRNKLVRSNLSRLRRCSSLHSSLWCFHQQLSVSLFYLNFNWVLKVEFNSKT